VADISILNPLSLIISYKISFLIIRLKMSSLPTLALKYHKNIPMVFKEFIEYFFLFLVEAALHIINFILCSSMNVENNDILLLTNSTFLTSDKIFFYI
jgi:hypothetical protein